MDYEVDVLAVGDKSRSGDAIALRYGNLNGPREQQVVVTIDGGNKESGEALVGHIQQFYKTKHVDFAILTHPDTDHVSGMRSVVEYLRPNVILMHQPWNHSDEVKRLADDGRLTVNSVEQRLEESLEIAKQVEEMAVKSGIRIVEPFAGIRSKDGVIHILGPTEEFYQQQVVNFRGILGATVTATEAHLKAGSAGGPETEAWAQERLADPSDTASSAANNSSAIILFNFAGKKFLFTGDAGTPAIGEALLHAQRESISLTDLALFQIPHHGSRKNIGPKLLNQMFGRPRPTDQSTWAAVVSAATEGAPKHPNKKVLNAIKRRGGKVFVTAGSNLCWSNPKRHREGWTPSDPQPFFQTVPSDAETA